VPLLLDFSRFALIAAQVASIVLRQKRKKSDTRKGWCQGESAPGAASPRYRCNFLRRARKTFMHRRVSLPIAACGAGSLAWVRIFLLGHGGHRFLETSLVRK